MSLCLCGDSVFSKVKPQRHKGTEKKSRNTHTGQINVDSGRTPEYNAPVSSRLL